MTARTHDAFAFASLLTVAILFPPQNLNVATLMVGLVANVIGGLTPDIDQATNRLWDLLPAGDEYGKVLRRIFIKHRTITHSLVGVFLIYHIMQWLLPRILNSNYIDINIIFISYMVGYLSHLIADTLTKDGLPLFFPFSLKIGFPPLRSLRVSTGGTAENLLILPALGLYLFWLVYNHQEILKNIFKLVVN